jgi:hypothetical protein
MKLIYANIELFNNADEILFENGYLTADKIRKVAINVMADAGVIRLAIKEKIRAALDLRVR